MKRMFLLVFVSIALSVAATLLATLATSYVRSRESMEPIESTEPTPPIA